MGVLDRVAAKVEAMVDPAVEITQEVVRASADLASAGLRFVDKELYFLQRELRRETRGTGSGKGKKR